MGLDYRIGISIFLLLLKQVYFTLTLLVLMYLYIYVASVASGVCSASVDVANGDSFWCLLVIFFSLNVQFYSSSIDIEQPHFFVIFLP